MDRRSFFGLVAGGATALRVESPLANAPLSADHVNASVRPMPDPRISMEQYRSDTFASRVGEVFSFHRTADANDAPVHLELVDVQASTLQPKAGGRQSFSLLFVLRSDDATQESTLHLRHDAFQPCAWFVNRVAAPERKGHLAYYEAVFG